MFICYKDNRYTTSAFTSPHTHTHTHTYIYIYIYILPYNSRDAGNFITDVTACEDVCCYLPFQWRWRGRYIIKREWLAQCFPPQQCLVYLILSLPACCFLKSTHSWYSSSSMMTDISSFHLIQEKTNLSLTVELTVIWQTLYSLVIGKYVYVFQASGFQVLYTYNKNGSSVLLWCSIE